MSRRDGIGSSWYERYAVSDVYAADRVVLDGRELPPPKFYDRRYEVDHVMEMELIRWKREKTAKKSLDDRSQARLNIMEAVKIAEQSHQNRLVG